MVEQDKLRGEENDEYSKENVSPGAGWVIAGIIIFFVLILLFS